MKIRKASVAGRFYPSNPKELKELIEEIRIKELPRIKTDITEKLIIGGIVPHAGYMYSGYEAVHFFEIISKIEQKFDTVVIFNPNHSGYGHDVSLDDHQAWETPLGVVKIDEELGEELELPYASVAHKHEHSGEVMIPFLQYFLPYQFKILPVTILRQTYAISVQLAEKLYKAVGKSGKRILIIASSDFCHYVSPERGKVLDDKIIDSILLFNSKVIEENIKKFNISVCGYSPIMTLMEYAKLTSSKPVATVLRRGHSGEVIPSQEVVDYVTILVSGNEC